MINNIRLATDRIPTVISSCFILHNIAKHLQDDDYDIPHDPELENMQAEGVEQVNAAGALFLFLDIADGFLDVPGVSSTVVPGDTGVSNTSSPDEASAAPWDSNSVSSIDNSSIATVLNPHFRPPDTNRKRCF
ncbi:hypothetical protein C0J52_05942 [Blattella germanica]|nr:hypothetical protein C0J52_05942 [Blattella germanica]